MRVRLTRRQFERVDELVSHALRAPNEVSLAFQEWWGRDIAEAAKLRVDVAMPAAGWRVVEAVLFDHCFDERGFRSKEVRSTDLNAIKAIRRAMNARENHPALYRRGAIGMISEMIPAWRLDKRADGAAYSPYPIEDTEFVVLAPEFRTVRTKRTTLWVEAPVAGRLHLFDAYEHWRFC